MPLVYVATSKSLAEWGASVGLTKSIYKLGLSGEPKEKLAEILNTQKHAGREDWKLLKAQATDLDDEESAIERAGRRERLISADLYPGIKGAGGIFKVKPENVENYLVVQAAMADQPLSNAKVKPADIAAYLIQAALGGAAEAPED